MSKKGWAGYNPMAAPIFEAQADAMILRHAERNLTSSAMLQALCEKHPEKWGVIAEGMQDSIRGACETGNLKLLADTLAAIERLYRNIARDHGMDPDTGERI
jgi:hypothetical protein